jgi:hypothetical protein
MNSVVPCRHHVTRSDRHHVDVYHKNYKCRGMYHKNAVHTNFHKVMQFYEKLIEETDPQMHGAMTPCVYFFLQKCKLA